LQQPHHLAFKLPPHFLESASLQPWCLCIKQRLWLLYCCRPLSTLAIRLACEVDREGLPLAVKRGCAHHGTLTRRLPGSFEHASMHPLLCFHL
jgi:hypothetical protein